MRASVVFRFQEAPQDDGREQAVSLDGTPQQASLSDDVLLANEFVQSARPHPRCQRGFAFNLLLCGMVKEVHAPIINVSAGN